MQPKRKLVSSRIRLKESTLASSSLRATGLQLKLWLNRSKASERKSLLTGLFVREFEYGTGDEVPPEIVDYYSARLASRVSRIEQLRNLRKEREQGIAFTESDIGLLKKAYSIQDWSVTWTRQSTTTDGFCKNHRSLMSA
jgi:hypothetical protein